MADSKLIEQSKKMLNISEPIDDNNLIDSNHHSTTTESNNDGEDLQEFTHWVGDDGASMHDDSNVNHGGWSVEEMFKTNQSLGVHSTFKDDLTQYTT